jgi:D-cysteine desulfhydrase
MMASGDSVRDAPPLFKRFPGLRAKIPYLALGSMPTPIEKAEELGGSIGIHNLYIKRDDLAGETYGGSKIRKLEFLLAEAKSLGKTRVITFGGAGSNHAVATALYAQRLGLKTTLMLLPQPINDEVRHRLLAARHFGAEIRIGPSSARAKQAEAARAIREDGQDPYWIETGGSSLLGNVGLVNAAFELKEQVDAGLMPEPDFLYIALGTMGSAVGLMLGLEAAGMKTVVVPVRASSPDTSSEAKLAAMFKETNEYLRALDPSFPVIALDPPGGGVRGGYLGKGYGLPTPKGTRAMAVFKEHTGVGLEPTYTGKTFAAVMDDAKDLAGKVVLFWNTYGSKRLNLGSGD